VPEPIKLYLDEDTISHALIQALRSRAIDVLTAAEAGLLGASDEAQLETATSFGRALVTFNTQDFAKLHTLYMQAGRHHTGIIVADQLPVGPLLRRLLRLLNTHTAEDMRDWLEYLSNWR
jgi:hypothetical protein